MPLGPHRLTNDLYGPDAVDQREVEETGGVGVKLKELDSLEESFADVLLSDDGGGCGGCCGHAH